MERASCVFTVTKQRICLFCSLDRVLSSYKLGLIADRYEFDKSDHVSLRKQEYFTHARMNMHLCASVLGRNSFEYNLANYDKSTDVHEFDCIHFTGIIKHLLSSKDLLMTCRNHNETIHALMSLQPLLIRTQYEVQTEKYSTFQNQLLFSQQCKPSN